MFENETEAAIRQRMLAKAPQGINTLEGDFFYDAVSPAAIELTLAYQQLDKVLRLGFAETAYGTWLDKITAERGVYRKPATKGSGVIEVTMKPNFTFPKGAVLATWEGNVRFVAIEEVMADGAGKALVRFENEAAGNQGNILPNTTFVAPVTINGFISARNPEQINAGTEQETDDSLRQRYYETVRTPVTSGNKHHYRNWAKEVPGVGDAKVFPLKGGPNTVGVMIIDSNKQPASAELVKDVQDYIDPEPRGCGEGKAPIGAYCTVTSAEGVAIHVSAVIVEAEGSAVKPMFEEALTKYLQEIAFIEPVVSYAKINAILLECVIKAGGKHHTDLKVYKAPDNSGTGNISINPDQVAVRGTVTLT